MKFSFDSIVVLAAGALPVVLGQSHVAVVGPPAPSSGAVPLRLDINVLANSGAQWDLYIQALRAMYYNTTSSDPLSFFQVAGIHGRPFIDWNNSGPQLGDDWLGFCPHGEKMFATWHRPYLMLYEQILVSKAQQIANTYPSRYLAQYQQAAASLRSPWWDWASNQTMPSVTVPQYININVPDGSGLKQSQVENPLWSYRYPNDAINGKYGYVDSNTRTYRCNARGQSYPKTANQNLANSPYHDWTYDAFTFAKDFNDFSTTGSSGISLEQIHNSIHWDATCGGQFLDAATSGFESIFYLHHTNVDRLWAYWQAIKPKDANWAAPYAGGSRWGNKGGTTLTADSPLQPFFAGNGKFHTGRTISSINGLGYSYVGLEYWSKSASQMQSDATALINKLYGSSTTTKRGADEQTTRHMVEIQLDVTEVQRPCQVLVHIKGQYAGKMVVMMQPATGIVHGAFTLDQAVQDAGVATSQDKADLDQINKSLEVEIVKPDGSTIALNTVPSLKVELKNVNVTAPSSPNKLPEVVDSNSKVAIQGGKKSRQ